LVEQVPEAVPEPASALVANPKPEAPVSVQAESSPSGESDIPLQPASTTIAEGFAGMIPAVGTWKLRGENAAQLDPKQYYAKLVLPLEQGGISTTYSFKARSTGYKWVGLGIHIFARSVATHRGYGEGESILVWLTSDPVYRGDAKTRIQVYRSLRDSYMEKPLGETVIPESIFDLHEYRVEADPAAGSLVVFVDGEERYRLEGLDDFSSGAEVALRALDTAEFMDFRVETAR
jgi:hypothetical protein